MNRKAFLFGNLVLLVGFAAGYAAAFSTARKMERMTPPVVITQPAAGEAPAPQSSTAPAPIENTSGLSDLQTQLAEKTAKINELEHKLAKSSHETVPAEEDTPEYREKLAAELLEITRTKEMIQQAFSASLQGLAGELTAEGQEALNQAMKRIYSWDKMEKIFSKVYTDVFSAQELNDLAEYYRSDVGLAMLKKQPELMQKTMQLVQQINQEALPKLKTEVDAIVKKHQAQPAGSGTEPASAKTKAEKFPQE